MNIFRLDDLTQLLLQLPDSNINGPLIAKIVIAPGLAEKLLPVKTWPGLLSRLRERTLRGQPTGRSRRKPVLHPGPLQIPDAAVSSPSDSPGPPENRLYPGQLHGR